VRQLFGMSHRCQLSHSPRSSTSARSGVLWLAPPPPLSCLSNDLRVALAVQMCDSNLSMLVDAVMAHYDQAFQLKSLATWSDVFHVMSGMWLSPVEQFFMWLGEFRPSEVLKAVAGQLEKPTEQQLVGICNLQQMSLRMRSRKGWTLAETLASAAGCAGDGPADSVTNYVGQMAMAMAKLGTLENFLRQVGAGTMLCSYSASTP
jgi:transcription factor TGA